MLWRRIWSGDWECTCSSEQMMPRPVNGLRLPPTRVTTPIAEHHPAAIPQIELNWPVSGKPVFRASAETSGITVFGWPANLLGITLRRFGRSSSIFEFGEHDQDEDRGSQNRYEPE